MNMLIACNECEARVDAKIIAFHDRPEKIDIEGIDGDDFKPIYRIHFLECPVCKSALIAGMFIEGIDALTTLSRVWPQPEKFFDWNIPNSVRISLEEAHKCYSASAYLACAVMCGRVLEGISLEYGTKDKTLAGGLKELLDRGVIDKRIFEWGEALRRHRNIAAHVSKEIINKADAKDLLDFAEAICEYIFVLSSRFEKFMSRKQPQSPTIVSNNKKK
jgi:hypothetical protein